MTTNLRWSSWLLCCNVSLAWLSLKHSRRCCAFTTREGRSAALIRMKRPRKRLRMFSLLLASINIHYNVSLSERINSFHLQLPKIASAKAPNISHSPASQRSPPGLSDLHPRDLHHLAIGDHALGVCGRKPRAHQINQRDNRSRPLICPVSAKVGLSATLADFSRARDSQITFSVT